VVIDMAIQAVIKICNFARDWINNWAGYPEDLRMLNNWERRPIVENMEVQHFIVIMALGMVITYLFGIYLEYQYGRFALLMFFANGFALIFLFEGFCRKYIGKQPRWLYRRAYARGFGFSVLAVASHWIFVALTSS
jgi:hypothetical protein